VLSCKDVSELVSQALDRPLGPVERWRVWMHVRACNACRNFKTQMTFLRKAFRHHPVRNRSD
jgi:hypothetical protein